MEKNDEDFKNCTDMLSNLFFESLKSSLDTFKINVKNSDPDFGKDLNLGGIILTSLINASANCMASMVHGDDKIEYRIELLRDVMNSYKEGLDMWFISFAKQKTFN